MAWVIAGTGITGGGAAVIVLTPPPPPTIFDRINDGIGLLTTGLLSLGCYIMMAKSLEDLEEEAEQLKDKIASAQDKIEEILRDSREQSEGGLGPYSTKGTENYIRELTEKLRRVVQEINKRKAANP
jgi:hypothetical protein